MGRTVQIRVIAQTPRPEDILDRWPRLVQLAWDGEQTLADGRKRGVLELARDLHDKLRFAVSEDVREALEPHAAKAVDLVRDLEDALGDWDATRANTLSEELESALDEAEPLAPEPPFGVSRR